LLNNFDGLRFLDNKRLLHNLSHFWLGFFGSTAEKASSGLFLGNWFRSEHQLGLSFSFRRYKSASSGLLRSYGSCVFGGIRLCGFYRSGWLG
jgi:hypothetical protein